MRTRCVLSVLFTAAALLTVAAAPSELSSQLPAVLLDGDAVPAASAVPAAPWQGSEIQISTPTIPECDRYYPSVAYNPQHAEYLVLWQNKYGTASDSYRDIWARRVRFNGQAIGSPFNITASGSGLSRFQASVAYNATRDEYMVVWVQDPGDHVHYEIWGRTVAWNGSSMGSETQIFTFANRSYWNPSLAWNSYRNEYFVAWSGLDTTNAKANDVSGIRLSGTGAVIPGVSIIEQDQAMLPTNVAVVYNLAADEYLAVWQHYVSAANAYDIYARRISWNGGFPAGAFTVRTSANSKMAPALATNGQNRYFVAWQEMRSGDWDVLGQRLDLSGGAVGGLLGAPTTDNEQNPAVACGFNSDQCLMLWQRTVDFGSSVYDQAVYADLIDASTSSGGLEIAKVVFYDYEAPAAVYNGAGYLMVYEGDSAGDPGVYRHIYGRLLAGGSRYLPLIKR